jgi:hypothetical protein
LCQADYGSFKIDYFHLKPLENDTTCSSGSPYCVHPTPIRLIGPL